MKRLISIKLLFFFLIAFTAKGQHSLPAITVNSFNEKVIVSWLNDYTKPISNIFIQRSYDSLKNFTTIGSVFVPQNKENGYPDNNPPYNRMYYRVSITFEGGEYEIGPSARSPKKSKDIPVIDIKDLKTKIITKELFWQPMDIIELQKIEKNDSIITPGLKIKNQTTINIPEIKTKTQQATSIEKENITIEKPIPPIEKVVTYPSAYLFANKQNSVTIHLPDASNKKYVIKFFNDSNEFLFELTKLNEDYLIIEKVNFVHAGWFYFELFDNGISVEKNKFYISSDTKSGNK